MGDLGPPQGRLIVLMHHGGEGFGREPWPEPFPELATRSDPWRILRIDRLGYGMSDPRPAGFPPDFLETDLAHVARVLDQLAPGRSAALVGSSDGGTLALLAAARWPQRVDGVAVVGAHYKIESSMIPVLQDLWRRFEEKHGPPQVGEAEDVRTVRLWFPGKLDICALGWNIQEELARVRCPAAVMQGELDGIVEDRYAHELAAALGGPASVEILPGGVHLCQKSHPLEWAVWLTRFLESLPSRQVTRS